MATERLRGTQSVVGQMGWVLARPSVVALEVVWRWLVGAPVLAVAWMQAQAILAALPPESAGLTSIEPGNPWMAAIKLDAAWQMYQPHVWAVLGWLAPAAGLAWVMASAIGRNLVLKRMEPRLPFRLGTMIMLQAVSLGAVGLAGYGWFRAVSWAAASHMGNGGEPDLLGYTIWVVFLTLAFVVVWAVVSWVVTVAPILALLEECGPATALARSVRLGKPFTAKLVEINFVMSIVTLALIVVAMVFSSVLIPFAEQVGAGTLHLEWLVVSVFYFVASDYFQVVRLKGFLEFWQVYRGGQN